VARVDVPALDCFFSGTGDMFAALTVARLSEAVSAVVTVRKFSGGDGVEPDWESLKSCTEVIITCGTE
jgi:pyridoxal/pyridoxine/pyridoxamine kinase